MIRRKNRENLPVRGERGGRTLPVVAIAAFLAQVACGPGGENVPIDTVTGTEVAPADVAADLPDVVLPDGDALSPDAVPELPDFQPDPGLDAAPDLLETHHLPDSVCGDGGCDTGGGLDSGEKIEQFTVCGNGLCEPGLPKEDPQVCPQDCGSCGDEICGKQEMGDPCPCALDCLPTCGNGECEGGETAIPEEDGYCPPDCGGCGDGVCGYRDLFEPELADCKDQDCSADCGDQDCSGTESWEVCPPDCGWCGDGVCAVLGETNEDCPLDCIKPCGDGICNGQETEESCAVDCGPCGDDVCGILEMLAGYCPVDCPPYCGNGECEPTETEDSCVWDCGCLPECKGKECGPEGCGGLCGQCPEGIECTNGKCCIPACFGKDCGDDGCGGACGYCPPGKTCEQGFCVEPDCPPQCEGKECGPDGCGGLCGTCGDEFPCTAESCSDQGLCQTALLPYYCKINGVCYISGEANPANPCEKCTPVKEGIKEMWIPVPEGTACGVAGMCEEGMCCDPGLNCMGKECGDDGCGAVCGQCGAGYVCAEGVCVEGVCQGCGDKECGVDDCGNSCGQCNPIPPCAPGPGDCENGQCQYGVSSSYCLIDGECVVNGASEEGDQCQVCNSGDSGDQFQWSDAADGADCTALPGGVFPDYICYQGECCPHIENCVDPDTGTDLDCGPDGCGWVCGWCSLDQKCGDDGFCRDCWDDDDGDKWDGCVNGVVTEFQVNSYEAGDQRNPRVDAFSDGRFVVVWESQGQDQGNSWGIYARVFGTDGLPAGDEILLNLTEAGDQQNPDVAVFSDDTFVVVWTGQAMGGSGGQDVATRLFEGDGSTLSTELIVAKYGGGTALVEPAVVTGQDGSFLVAWTGDYIAMTGPDVLALLLGPDWQPDGPVFSPCSLIDDSQTSPAIAIHGTGQLAAAWVGEFAGQLPGQKQSDIRAQIFDGDGPVKPDDFNVNTLAGGNQVAPSIAPCGDMGFVVVWQDDGSESETGSAVMGQRVSLTGELVGGHFKVNWYLDDSQGLPAVAAREDGSFVAVYSGLGPVQSEEGDEYYADGVYARRFDSTETPNPQDFGIRANTHESASGAWHNDIAVFADGGFVVVWDNAGQDAGGNGIYAQRFTDDGVVCEVEDCLTGPDVD